MTFYTNPARAASRVKYPRLNGAPDSAPADFDATANPIISLHWFGVDPLRPVGHVVLGVVAALKRKRQIEHVHRLGPRAVGELLYEVAGGKNLDRALEPYQRLTPNLLKAVGGDRFAPLPIHGVKP